MNVDKYAQPLGWEVENWQGATPPQRVVMEGRFCRVEPFSQAMHGDSLRALLMEDEAGWAYLMPAPADAAAYDAWFEQLEYSSDPLFFAIVEHRSGRALGIASYLRIDAAGGVIEVGWLRFSPRLQRTAAATEAMYLMMRQAFAWGYRRYEWKCNALNAPSLRAAQRLGFQFEGIFRQARVNWGLSRDTAWFSLLDSEWPANRDALERWLDAANFDEQGKQRRTLTVCRQRGVVHDGTVTVRLATMADLYPLAELFDAYRGFYGKSDDGAQSFEFIRQRLQKGDSCILLAEQNGLVCGFVQLYPLFSSVGTAEVWLLNDVYVAAHARRQGVGKALLQTAAEHARGQGILRLELSTAEDNHAAQTLYAQLGWQHDTAFRHYQLALK